MAIKLFEVEGGFSDGNIHYLSGTGAPGGDAGPQDVAPVGSQYVNSSAVPPVNYTKRVAGAGAGNWALLVKSDRVSKEFTQTAHGLSAGDWIYRDASGAFLQAQADDPNTSDVVGVVETVGDANTFTLVSHGFTDLAFSATDGAALFLSTDTAGSASLTKPIEGVQKNLGFVLDGLIFVGIGLSVEISTTEAPAVPLIVTDNITTIQSVASVETQVADGALWVITATSATGRYQSVISFTHDGISGDATDTSWTEFAITTAGSVIAGLALGMSLTGTGAAQTANVTVVATDEVDVALRQIQV